MKKDDKREQTFVTSLNKMSRYINHLEFFNFFPFLK